MFACLQYHCHKLGLLAETNLKDINCWKPHRLPKTKLKQCFPLFVAIRNKRFDFDWMSDCLIDWKLCECQKHFFSYLKCLIFYNKTKVLEMLTHQKAQPGEKTDIYLPCLRLFPNEPFSTCICTRWEYLHFLFSICTCTRWEGGSCLRLPDAISTIGNHPTNLQWGESLKLCNF